jgi:hypothetical protein
MPLRVDHRKVQGVKDHMMRVSYVPCSETPYGTSSYHSYHLYHPTSRNHSITPTLSLSNLGLPNSFQRLKALRPTSGHRDLDSLILIIELHHQRHPNRHMLFLVFLLLQVTPLAWIWVRSWRGINWKFRWYCRNVQRLSRCLVRSWSRRGS